MSQTNKVTFDTKELEEKARESGYSLHELSELAGMSPSYLTSCFKSGVIDLKILTKIYEIIGRGDAPKTSRTRTYGRYLSRNYTTINGDHCREIMHKNNYTLESTARILHVSGRAVGTWFEKNYLPDNLLTELAELFDVDEQELLKSEEPEPKQLDFNDCHVYSAEAVRAIMQDFVNSFSDYMMDYLGKALDNFGREDGHGSF